MKVYICKTFLVSYHILIFVGPVGKVTDLKCMCIICYKVKKEHVGSIKLNICDYSLHELITSVVPDFLIESLMTIRIFLTNFEDLKHIAAGNTKKLQVGNIQNNFPNIKY